MNSQAFPCRHTMPHIYPENIIKQPSGLLRLLARN
uniref:Uncharacterized protein n=1 Tax=Anguilla anguilla TaxID=7936 RepID=A0A0E9SQL2_ANGAN